MEVYKKDEEHHSQICIVHGLGEHCGRYIGMAKMIALQGFKVRLIDLRGFGLSGGARAQSSLTEFFWDIKTLIKQCENDKPLFLMGHSMGAGLITLFLQQNKGLNLSGVILSSPFYKFPKSVDVNYVKKQIVAFLARNNPVPVSLI